MQSFGSNAAEIELVIEQGASFSYVITWQDDAGVAIDLTGYTARAQGRDSYSASAKIYDLTTENGGLSINGAAGEVTMTLTAAATAAMTFSKGRHDLEVVSGGGMVYRLIEGPLRLSREVTR